MKAKRVLLISDTHGFHENLEEVVVEKNHSWCNHTIQELNLPQNQLIALIKRGDENIIPSGSTLIHEGDIVVLYR